MPVPASISDLSTTPASNFPAGSESPSTIDDYLRTYASYIALLRDGKGQSAELTLASAATVDIGASNSPFVNITGATTITSFGTNYTGARFIRFSGVLTLTHNATTLILPGGANITTAAGDACIAVPYASGWRVVVYTPFGAAYVTPANAQTQTYTAFTSAGTAPAYTLTPSPAISAYAAGQRFRVKFHAGGTTGSNTLNVNGKGALHLKQYDATGTKVAGVVASGQLADVEYDGTDFVILDPLPVVATTTQKGSVQLSTNSVAQGGTNVTDALTPAALKAAQIQPGTVVNSTSGTAIDFTGIPAWVNRITVTFSVVSTSGSNALQLQLGSGSVQVTGYTGAASGILGATGGSISLTSGFALTPGGSIDAAGSQRSGSAVLTRLTGSTWALSGSLGVSGLGSAGTTYFGGVVAVSGVVDRIRLTTVGATDAFDGGQVNISLE